ncbi:hypothetical protein PJW08_04860 [Tenacibaculum finnmarkense]|nr:hypothetical protein PJW08_04860 [Tenacibaculum finnmarkense]
MKSQATRQLIIGVVITTFGWILVTLLTKPTDKKTIDNFEGLIFEGEDKFKNIGIKIVGFITGTIGVYSFLFATGNSDLRQNITSININCNNFNLYRDFTKNLEANFLSFSAYFR